VLRATLMTVQAATTSAQRPRIPVSREDFWVTQQDAYADKAYRVYRHPDQQHRELQRIAAHCRQRGIRLRFIVFPTFTTVRGRLAAFNLEREFERFKLELSEIAPTIDFDYDSALTTNRANFADPVHITAEVNRHLADEIWSGKPGFGHPMGK
jgi:hypothetical protein